jgi:hypothetical protein
VQLDTKRDAAQASVPLLARSSSFIIFAAGLNIWLPKALDWLRQRVSPMVHIAKKATQDGTFTVYVENRPVAWGLTSSAADILMERMHSR